MKFIVVRLIPFADGYLTISQYYRCGLRGVIEKTRILKFRGPGEFHELKNILHVIIGFRVTNIRFVKRAFTP